MDLTYILYDTAVFGATANVEFILFQVPQGADATHTESFTNARGPGAMPTGESFLIRKVSVFPDLSLLEANVDNWFRGGFIEIRLADKTQFKAPLALVMDAASFGGSDASTAAVNQNHVGLLGDGYELADHPILLPPGEVFRVRVFQATITAATTNIKVALHGVLTTPG